MSAVLDIFYPPVCGLCAQSGRPAICDDCLNEFPERIAEVRLFAPEDALAASHSLYPYEGRAAQAVQRLKYERATGLAAAMSVMLAEAIEQKGLDAFDLLIPVPIHWSRRSMRGFNQSEMLTRHITAPPLLLTGLKRIRKTKPQVELTALERRRAMRDAFRADPSVRGKRVLLLDDVITTGGTAQACAGALRAAGAARVEILTFCGESVLPELQASGDRSP